MDGTAWVLRPDIGQSRAPISHRIADKGSCDFEVISLLARLLQSLLNYERIADQDVPKWIAQWRDDVMNLVEMLQPRSDPTNRLAAYIHGRKSLVEPR